MKQDDRRYALDMIRRIELHIQKVMPHVPFIAIRELREEIRELMFLYNIVKIEGGYSLA